MKKKGAVIVAMITFFYALLAFFRLGDTVAPQTFWAAEPGEILRIDLGRAYTLSRVCVYSGIARADYEFFLAETPFSQQQEIGTLEEPYCFHWNAMDTSLTGRYLFLRVKEYAGSLGELAIFDCYGNAIPIPKEETWAELTDEPETAVFEPTYRNSTYFDEIYHARTAYEFLHQISPYETTHPPLGKVLISIGIALFGMTPFGWRFVGTLFGCTMLPLMYLLGKRLFQKEEAGVLASVLMALDFMHFSQTRIATIDTYALFFILLMTLFMVTYLQTHSYRSLVLCGIAFGLGAASKWTCIYAGGGLAVLFFTDLFLHRRDAGFWNTALRRCLWCLLFFVLIPVGIYALSYLPWTRCAGQSWQTVWNNQFDMYNYHSKLVADHPYSTPWYEWPVMVKPMVFYRQGTLDGKISTIASFGNPLIWWGGLIALFATAYAGIKRRDAAAWPILCGYLAQLLPWVAVTRIVFLYHYFNCTPFLILSLVYLTQRFPKVRRYARWFVAAAALLFVLFYPVLSGFEVPASFVSDWLCWFPQWYFA